MYYRVYIGREILVSLQAKLLEHLRHTRNPVVDLPRLLREPKRILELHELDLRLLNAVAHALTRDVGIPGDLGK